MSGSNPPKADLKSNMLLDLTQKQFNDQEEKSYASKLNIGQRVWVQGLTSGTVTVGSIRYKGSVDFDKRENWLGVELDIPQKGRHNGTVKGREYFRTLRDECGIFCRPRNVNKVPDFLRFLGVNELGFILKDEKEKHEEFARKFRKTQNDLERKHNQCKEELDHEKKARESLRKKVRELEELNESLKVDLSAGAEERIKELLSTIDRTQKELKETEENMQKLETAYAESQVHVQRSRSLENKVEQLNEEIETFKEDRKTHIMRQMTLENNLKEKNKMLAREREVWVLERERLNKSDQLQEMKKEISQLKADLKEFEKKQAEKKADDAQAEGFSVPEDEPDPETSIMARVLADNMRDLMLKDGVDESKVSRYQAALLLKAWLNNETVQDILGPALVRTVREMNPGDPEITTYVDKFNAAQKGKQPIASKKSQIQILISGIIVVIYLLVGGAMFEGLERGEEEKLAQLTGEDNQYWTYRSSVFFSLTILSTVGYGVTAPQTVMGKGLLVPYAILGIPVFTYLLIRVTKVISRGMVFSMDWLLSLFTTSHKSHVYGKGGTFNWFTALVLSTAFMGALLIGAVVYFYGEGWTLSDALYFSFITLSTIGFGDFVPTKISTQAITSIFIIAFMGTLTEIFELITDYYEIQSKKIERLIRRHCFGEQIYALDEGNDKPGSEKEKDNLINGPLGMTIGSDKKDEKRLAWSEQNATSGPVSNINYV
ncbi:hypothetical protein AAMO2058_000279100 [Amorphochlora amoebiformis]